MFLSLALALLGQAATQKPPPQLPQKAPDAEVAKAEPQIAVKLLQVRRIYVESFGDDPSSRQFQAMIVNALAVSKKFIITENPEKADAILKGNTGQLIHQESHSSSEGVSVRTRDSASISESSHATETISEVSVAVRLVSNTDDADVIWATTKESKGAKYKGAGADVADQVVKQLLGDLEKLKAQAKGKENSK